MRSYGIVVDDVTKHLSVYCTLLHLIYILSMDLHLAFEMDGVISYIYTCYPNQLEIESCTNINLTSSTVWELHLELLAELEALVTYNSDMIHPGKSRQTIYAIHRKGEVISTLSKVSPVLVEDDFIDELESNVQVSAAQAKSHHSEINAHETAPHWEICIKTAE